MRIKIIYETQTGTTQYVAEVLQRELTAAGHEVRLHSLKYQGTQPDINEAELLIFGAPTYDDGLLEKTTRTWIKEFHPDLSQKKVAIFALGNRTYPQFCTAAKLLEDWVASCQGKPIIETFCINDFPADLVPIETWAAKLNQMMSTDKPLEVVKAVFQPQTR